MFDGIDLAITTAQIASFTAGSYIAWLATLSAHEVRQRKNRLVAFRVRLHDREAQIHGTWAERIHAAAKISSFVVREVFGPRLLSAKRLTVVAAVLVIGFMMADTIIAGGHMWALISAPSKHPVPPEAVLLITLLFVALPLMVDAHVVWFLALMGAVGLVLWGGAAGAYSSTWVAGLVVATIVNAVGVDVLMRSLRQGSVRRMFVINVLAVIVVPVLAWGMAALGIVGTAFVRSTSSAAVGHHVWPVSLAMLLASGPIILAACTGVSLLLVSFLHQALWTLTRRLVALLAEQNILQKKRWLIATAAALFMMAVDPGGSATIKWLQARLSFRLKRSAALERVTQRSGNMHLRRSTDLPIDRNFVSRVQGGD